jgi:hypothetical protein
VPQILALTLQFFFFLAKYVQMEIAYYQEFNVYKNHVTNAQNLSGVEVKALLSSVLEPYGTSGMDYNFEKFFEFMYGASARNKKRPWNHELIICKAFAMTYNSLLEPQGQKNRHKHIKFFAKRALMHYPGIAEDDLPADVGSLHGYDATTITLNDLMVGVNKGYIWVCNGLEPHPAPPLFTNMVMPFDSGAI